MALSRPGCVILGKGVMVMAGSAIASLRVQSIRNKRRARMLGYIFAALKVDISKLTEEEKPGWWRWQVSA